MTLFNFCTPFADVEVRIKDEDAWAKDEIIEWLCKETGQVSPKEYGRVMKAFDDKRGEIKRTLNEH